MISTALEIGIGQHTSRLAGTAMHRAGRVAPANARGHLPSPRRGPRRRTSPSPSSSVPSDAIVRVAGERHLRLGPAHLPRPRAGRAGLHDRTRVRRHGARRRPRRWSGPRSAIACSAAFTPPAGPARRASAATTTAALHGRTFGHGSKLGDLQGAQAERLLVPRANLVLRRSRTGISDDVALFAGDVLGTGYHAIAHARPARRRHGRGARPRPGGAVRGAGRPRRGRDPGVRDRHGARAPGHGRPFGATPLHLTEEDPKRRGPRRHRRAGRGRRRRRRRRSRAARARDQPRARRAERSQGSASTPATREVPLGLAWLKCAHAADRSRERDRPRRPRARDDLRRPARPPPLVTHHMTLDDAPEAYALYDRREALKIVLTP